MKMRPTAERRCWSPEVARRLADDIHMEVKDMVANSRLVRKGGGLALIERNDILIRRLLGTGAFSEVHEVKVKGMVGSNGNKTFAMKHLKSKLMGQEENFRLAASELAVEAHMLASFDHPHILKIRGWAANGVASFLRGRHDSFFLLLDTLDLTLDQQIAAWEKKQEQWDNLFPQSPYNNIVVDIWRRWNHSPVDRAEDARQEIRARQLHLEKEAVMHEKLRICHEIASALAYLHGEGVIFRDLKPNNLGLINGRIQLFDFGLSREIPNGNDLVHPYEMSGKVGTLRYMAVEVACHQPYNVSADVFSWAMVCYEILTLKKPFAGWTRDMHADLVCARGARPELTTESAAEQIIPLCTKRLLETSWDQEAFRRPSMNTICQELLMQRKEQVLLVQSLENDICEKTANARSHNMMVELPPNFEGNLRKMPTRHLSESTNSASTSSESWIEGADPAMIYCPVES